MVGPSVGTSAMVSVEGGNVAESANASDGGRVAWLSLFRGDCKDGTGTARPQTGHATSARSVCELPSPETPHWWPEGQVRCMGESSSGGYAASHCSDHRTSAGAALRRHTRRTSRHAPGP